MALWHHRTLLLNSQDLGFYAKLRSVRCFSSARPLFYFPDHYKELNLPIDASAGEIKKAYYRLSKVHHPDITRHLTGKIDDQASKFKALSVAYEVLADPVKRDNYDYERNRRSYVNPSARKSHYHGDAGDETTKTHDGASEGPTLNWDTYVRRTTIKKKGTNGSSLKYFWHIFWGYLIAWIVVTLSIFWSDKKLFGGVHEDLKREFLKKELAKMKELRRKKE